MKKRGVSKLTTPDREHVPESVTFPQAGQALLAAQRASPWLGNLLIALAYIAAALAGQQLTSPVAEVTSLWPAAGLALGALLVWGTHLWPGLWLGALLFNLWLDPSQQGALIAGLIASGATLQALLGARLTRHLLDAAVPLSREGEVAYLLLRRGRRSTCGCSGGAVIPSVCCCLHLWCSPGRWPPPSGHVPGSASSCPC